MSSRDRSIVDKILEYCSEIERTHAFFRDDKRLFCNKTDGFIYRNAVTMPILQIGELAKRLSDDLIRSHPSTPWRQIVRTRDLYAHHYGAIEYEIAWETSHESISELRTFLKSERKLRSKEQR